MSAEDFLILFKKEYKAYQKLKEKAELKKKAIIDNNIDELALVLNEEQELITEIENLENMRQDLLVDLADNNSIEDKTLSFKNLVALLPEEEKKELRELRNGFLQLLEDLQQINETNRELIQDSLQVNNFSLELLKKASGKDNTYTRDGQGKDDSEHFIDRRA